MFIARRVLKSNQREDHLVQVGEHLKYHRGRHSFLVVVVVVVAMVGDVNVDFVARPVVLVGVET